MAEFTCRRIDILTGHRTVLLNQKDCERVDIRAHDRVNLRRGDKNVTATVDTTTTIVGAGEIGVTNDLTPEVGVEEGDVVEVTLLPAPSSTYFIRKKIVGQKLSKDEIYSIVQDAAKGTLTDVEMAGFLMAQQFHGMTDEEQVWLTRAMADTGEKIDFEKPVYDKHSVGGVPGNKVSLLIVPIVASAGLLIPKTSSRAITSPSGTADTMSVLAPVEFSAAELKKLALKTGGAIVWGGSLHLAPADDIFIGVEHPLQIDPEPQMIASIMAKKLAVGADFMVLDLPVGHEAKIPSSDEGRRLSFKFINMGDKLGIKVRCGITYGGQPVGYAVGPALEAREAVQALEGEGPSSLVEKSTALAGMLLELAGKAVRGEGQALAKQILASGKALEKMCQIIEAQGGDGKIRSAGISIGQCRAEMVAPCDGYITRVSNAAVNQIARAAGAPIEKGAGIVLHVKEGHKISKGQKVIEIFAERDSRVDEAYNLAVKLAAISIEGMLLQEVSSD
ncbi:AMP phosphorylase [[Eubacterium] cellulosolvens]